VTLNYALLETWIVLERLYRTRAQTDNLNAVTTRIATLRALPHEVVVGAGLFADGDLTAAETLIRSFLNRKGEHVEALRLLARIAITLKLYFDARVLLARVLTLAPTYRQAREEYVFVLTELHCHKEARPLVRSLIQEDPGNRQLKILCAANSVGPGSLITPSLSIRV